MWKTPVLITISRSGDVFAHSTSLKPQLIIIHIVLCQAKKVIILHFGIVVIVWYFIGYVCYSKIHIIMLYYFLY
jgi:hypothetical protein